MRRYLLPSALTIAFLAIITGSTLYLSTQDQTRVSLTSLLAIIVIICLSGCATAWSWRRADRADAASRVGR